MADKRERRVRKRGKATSKIRSLLDLPTKRRRTPATPEEQQALDEAVRAFCNRVAWGDEAVAWGDEVVQRDVVVVARIPELPRLDLPPDELKQRHTAPGWAQKPVVGKLREKYPPDGIPPKGTFISEACREIGEDPVRRWHTVDRTVKRLKEAKRLRG
jgi:hypothetical protein